MFIVAQDSIHYGLKQHMDDFVLLKKKIISFGPGVIRFFYRVYLEIIQSFYIFKTYWNNSIILFG
jgi:hypothetical protein